MSIDAIGNFLTIIRNGIMASKPVVVAPYSTMRFAIGTILKDEGFIKDCQMLTDQTGKKNVKLVLKYTDGESVIHEIKRISTPGRRCYESIGSIKPVIGGLGIAILSTNRGVLTHKQAKKLSVGGEVICTIW